jgi:glycosyltransferase involved in cell wall biosynthesis
MNGISIVVCCYNSASRIESTLQSLFHQNFDKLPGYEIIIVDNASTDNTSAVCSQLHSTSFYSGDFTIIEERKAGLSFARLAGLFNAKYDWILFCDDDNHLFPDYLQRVFEIIHEVSDVGAIGGCGIPKFEGMKPDWFDYYSYSFAVGQQADHSGTLVKQPSELYGAGSIFKKQLLLNYFQRGFESVMSDRMKGKLVSGGDVEWCYLIQLSGHKLYYSSKLKFYHWMPISRMEWRYYLKLKGGISSGAGQLLSYQPFFKYSNPATKDFFTIYIKEFSKALLLFTIFKIRRAINSNHYSIRESDLGNVVLSEKVASLVKNIFISYQHFKQLKRLL